MHKSSRSQSLPSKLRKKAVLHVDDRGESSPRVLMEPSAETHNAIKAEMLSVFVGGSKCLLSETSLKIAETLRPAEITTDCGQLKQVQAGNCVGLVGPNGCGKSTLLTLLAKGRLPVPSEWDVLLVSQTLPIQSQKNSH